MRNLLRAELLKMRTIRVTYGRPAAVGRQMAAPGRGPGPRPGDLADGSLLPASAVGLVLPGYGVVFAAVGARLLLGRDVT
ncbi:MAG TPA: hypothetical protein VHF24_08300 [Acidimicrobiales bacterium]|nr:hypothetical protein [Acidimicrobiales bacterium]